MKECDGGVEAEGVYIQSKCECWLSGVYNIESVIFKYYF